MHYVKYDEHEQEDAANAHRAGSPCAYLWLPVDVSVGSSGAVLNSQLHRGDDVQHDGSDQDKAEKPEKLAGALQEVRVRVEGIGPFEREEISSHVPNHEPDADQARNPHHDFLAYCSAVEPERAVHRGLKLDRTHRLSDGFGAPGQRCLLIIGQRNLKDLLQSPSPKLTGNPEKQSGHPILSLEPRGAWENALLIANDRFTHLHRRCRRSVIGRAGLEIFHDLGAAVASALDDCIEPLLGHQLADWNAAHTRVGDERNHRVAVAAQDHRLDVADRDAERFCDERSVARGVEYAGHTEHALAWKAGDCLRNVRHDVERVRHHDDDRVGRSRLDVLGDLLDDARVGVEEIVTRHTRLAGDSRSDDDYLGVGGLVVAVRSDDSRIEAFDRCRLPLVETFALRDTFHDVHEDDFARELLFGDALRGRRANVPCADDRDSVDHFALRELVD